MSLTKDQRLLQQEDLVERVINAFKSYTNAPKDRKITAYIESRLELLEKMFGDFLKNHEMITVLVSKADRSKVSYFTEDVYSTLEDIYIDYKSQLKDDLTKWSLGARESRSEVKLPMISLPIFSGSYDEWQSFHDLFESLIHMNSTLSPVQKLYYLKGSLIGEAEQLLRNLAIKDSNYTQAWELLNQRYSNKRYNSNEIMKRLFSQKSINLESATAIKELLDTTSACLKALENMKISTTTWDVIINYLTITKLDIKSREQWETHVSQLESDDLPTWKCLQGFLETRFRTLEILDASNSSAKKTTVAPIEEDARPQSYHVTVQDDEKKKSKNTCEICLCQHPIYRCKQFGRQTPIQRTEFIQSKGLCFNCLASNHSVKNCHSSTCCRQCGRRHHTLLHFERNVNSDSERKTGAINTPVTSTERESKVVAHFAKESPKRSVLLATALVRVRSTNGYSKTVRALIDQGSEASFISEATAQSLNLKRALVHRVATGIGDDNTCRTKHKVTFLLESLNNEFGVPVNAFTSKNLTSFLPSEKINIPNWKQIENLPLADPNYGSPGKIDMLLGAEVYCRIISSGLIKHPEANGPIAQNTQLGWILSGTVETTDEQLPSNTNVSTFHAQMKEHQLLRQFWEKERTSDAVENKFTKLEDRHEKIFESSTRDIEGRPIMSSPFTRDPSCLKRQSREIEQLKTRTIENTKLHEKNQKGFQDYRCLSSTLSLSSGKRRQRKHKSQKLNKTCGTSK